MSTKKSYIGFITDIDSGSGKFEFTEKNHTPNSQSFSHILCNFFQVEKSHIEKALKAFREGVLISVDISNDFITNIKL